MSLTDAKIRAIRPRDKPFKTFDSKGLYIETFPNGSKLWRWKFRVAGKENRLTFGSYPETKLADARRLRDAERVKLSQGLNPSFERQRAKIAAKLAAADSFECIAAEYIQKMEMEGRAPSTLSKARWFVSLLQPAIGRMPISEVDPQLLLAAIRRIEVKGNFETAKKTRSLASRIFRYLTRRRHFAGLF